MTSWKKKIAKVTRQTLSVAIISVAAGGSALAADDISLRLDWSWWVGQTPFLVAKEKGYYDEVGLNVDVQQGQGSKTTTIVVGEGGDQVGHANLATAAQSISAGVPIKAIGGMWQKGPIALICKADLNVTTPGAVKGKRIGSTPTGSDAQVLPAFLGANNIDQSEVQIVNMQGDAKLGAFLTDKVDCISGDGFFWVPRIEAEGQKATVMLYADHGVPNFAYGIIANEAFLKDKPDVARRFLAATFKGYEFTFNNIDAAIDLFVEKTENTQSRDTLKGMLEYYSGQLHTMATEGKPLGWMAESDWDGMNAVLEKFGGMEGRKPASAYFANDYLPGS